MSIEPQAVLITGARAPAALEWVRLFHAAGRKVYVCDSLKRFVCRYSRLVSGSAFVPSPKDNTEAFIEGLVGLIRKYRIALVVPTCEEIFYVVKYRNGLEAEGAAVFTDQLPALLGLHNKYEFIRMVEKNGLPVPETYRITSEAELRDIVAGSTVSQKYVLKPVYSRFASKVRIIERSAGGPLVQAPDSLSPDCPWVLQRFIEGTPVCTYSIAKDGRLFAHAAYESRYRAGMGASVHFAAIEHPAVLRWVETFVAAEKLNGQIAFDFIVDREGTVYPIECNPRTTSGIHLFAPGDGVAETVLLSARENGVMPLIQPPVGRSSMIGMMMGVQAVRLGVPWAARVETVRDMLRSRDVLIRFRDPLPFWSQLFSLWELFNMSRRRGVSLLEASTIDLEWNDDG
ncbi:ATP-grasp domain-containing protein [Paenibacillus oceani]|uniref:ATP-grasp domain-containing protein n=1 Tax=Paenibacillus oceani TaxID=2772510 RepID=A0A927C7Y7_9BACL|nr:ATP-grasp domain-containing protein [Paenibacillus oceani]MBD2862845.1 ATP-grasp domain-containing protein [Paenibacillus oceani]